MIWLSFTSLKQFDKCPQTFLNKLAGLETEDFWYFKKGREVHEKIQAHFKGEKPIFGWNDIQLNFPEGEEFMQFELDDDYGFCGRADGYTDNTLLEIKTGSSLWSENRARKTLQWRLYSLFNSQWEKVFFLTAKSDLSTKKLYCFDITPEERDKAREYLDKKVTEISSGNFIIPEDRYCGRCVYRKNCEESLWD